MRSFVAIPAASVAPTAVSGRAIVDWRRDPRQLEGGARIPYRRRTAVNRRQLLMPAAVLSGAVLLAACGGSSATTSPTGAASAPVVATPAAGTSAAATPAAVPPTAVTPVAATPAEATPVTAPPIAVTPIPGTTFAPPSLTPDPVLAAKFPATIDGQPVTGVQTGLYSDILQQFSSSPEEFQKATAMFASIGIDFNRMSFGAATGTVDGTTVALVALRTPDTDANKIVQNYALIAGGLDPSPPPAPTMTQSNIGGKNVTLAVDSEGKTSVLYVTGDTLFLLTGNTDSQTAKILQALP